MLDTMEEKERLEQRKLSEELKEEEGVQQIKAKVGMKESFLCFYLFMHV